MAVFEYKIRIRYTEINEKNELSDKGLINLLSEVAGKHSVSAGYGLNDIEKTNYTWMILYWKIKVYKRPHWDTDLIVKTWGRDFKKVSCWRDFEVYDTEGEKIAIATSEWVLIDAKKLSLTKMTEEVKNAYGDVPKKVFEEEIRGKLLEPDNMEKVYEYTPKRRDIDVNNHVNNIHYVEYAYDALPSQVKPDFNNLEIFYKKQIKLGETISCYYKQEENSHIVAIKSQDGNTLHAILKSF